MAAGLFEFVEYKGSLVQRELSADRLTEGLWLYGCRPSYSASGTIPPSRLRRATSLYTREALKRVLIHTLSIIRVTISVAVLTYSVMLNCLTTSTS